MCTGDREAAHDSRDIFHRQLPAIRGRLFGHVARWVSASIVGYASIVASKMANLGIPRTGIGFEVMEKDDRITAAVFLEVKLHFARNDIRHRQETPTQIVSDHTSG